MDDKDKQDALLREYQEVGNNLRHYGNFRISRLAMFFTLNAALFVAREDVIQPRLRGIIGLLIAVLFFIADLHIRRSWGVFRDRGAEIDDILGLKQYKELKRVQSGAGVRWRRWQSKEFYISSTFSSRLTFAIFAIFWATKSLKLW